MITYNTRWNITQKYIQKHVEPYGQNKQCYYSDYSKPYGCYQNDITRFEYDIY